MGITFDKKIGKFYTKKVFIERILNLCDLQEIHSILEPSFGSGILFIATLERMIDQGIDVSSIVEKSLLVELDTDNFEYGMNKVNEFLDENGIDKRPRYLNQDFLLIKPNKFDFIIANPPYIRLKNMSFALRETIPESYKEQMFGNYDMYMIFMNKIIKEFEYKQIIFIIPQSFLSAKYSNEMYHELIDYMDKVFVFNEPIEFDRTSYATAVLNISSKMIDNVNFYLDWQKAPFINFRKKEELITCNGVATIKNDFFILPDDFDGVFVNKAVWPRKKNKKIFFPYDDFGKPITKEVLKNKNPKLYGEINLRVNELMRENKEFNKTVSSPSEIVKYRWPTMDNFLYGRSQYVSSVYSKKKRYLIPTFLRRDGIPILKRVYPGDIPMGGIIALGSKKEIENKIMNLYVNSNVKNGGYVQISTANFKKGNHVKKDK